VQQSVKLAFTIKGKDGMRSYVTRFITVISFCSIRKCMAFGKGESNSYLKAVYRCPMQLFNYEQHSPNKKSHLFHRIIHKLNY